MCKLCEKYKEQFGEIPSKSEVFVIHKIRELVEWNKNFVKEAEEIFKIVKENPQKNPLHALLKLSFVGSILSNALNAFHYVSKDKDVPSGLQIAFSAFLLEIMNKETEQILENADIMKIFKQKDINETMNLENIIEEHFKAKFEQN